MTPDLASMRAPGTGAARRAAPQSAHRRVVDLICTSLPVGAPLALALLGGCSLTVDVDRPQCKENADCLNVFGQSQGMCLDAYCVAITCTTSATCGADALCDMDQKSCIGLAQASCRNNDDCTHYDGAPRCAEGKCEPECRSDRECPSDSPTMKCVAGRCEDKTWGCIGEPDTRMNEDPNTAGFTIPLVTEADRKGIPGMQLKVCDLPHYDKDCMREIGKATYSAETGLATITGIVPGEPRMRLLITPPRPPVGLESEALVPTDYYSQRPIRGLKEEKGLVMFVSEGLVMNVNVTSKDGYRADRKKGSVIARIHDCQDNPAKDVTFNILEETPVDAFGFYFAPGTHIPQIAATKTDPTGEWSFVNIPHTRTYTIQARAGSKLVSQFVFLPIQGRPAYVDMYPSRN